LLVTINYFTMIDKVEKEHLRKIQVTGGSTYIISLPKSWVVQNDLIEKRLVRITELKNGMLLISPVEESERRPKVARITIGEGECDPYPILRRVISHYAVGYDIIIIEASDGILDPNCRDVIKDFVRRTLFGAEFMDEAAEFIKIQILTPYVNLPIKNIIKRMADLSINMHFDVIKALEYKDERLLNEIIKRDDDVDRLYFLSIRQLTSAIYSPPVSNDIGINDLHECLEYRLVVRHLERVADHATIISRMLLEVLKEINHDDIKILRSMNEVVRRSLSIAITSLLEKDSEIAERAISTRDRIRRLEDIAVKKLSMYRRARMVAALRMAVESYRRVSEYSAGIAEIAINLSVNRPSE